MFKQKEDPFSIKYIKTFIVNLLESNDFFKEVSLLKLKYDRITGLYIIYLGFSNLKELGRIHLNEKLNKLMISRGLNINYLIIWKNV